MGAQVACVNFVEKRRDLGTGDQGLARRDQWSVIGEGSGIRGGNGLIPGGWLLLAKL